MDTQKTIGKRILEEGDYTFKVLTAVEETTKTKYGECPTLKMTFLIDGEVKGYGIRIWLNEARKNKETLCNFLTCVGLQKPDGTYDIADDWKNLIGLEGSAHFTPKKLTQGGTVYEPSDWKKPEAAAPELEPVPEEEAESLITQVEDMLKDTDVPEAPEQETPIQQKLPTSYDLENMPQEEFAPLARAVFEEARKRYIEKEQEFVNSDFYKWFCSGKPMDNKYLEED